MIRTVVGLAESRGDAICPVDVLMGFDEGIGLQPLHRIGGPEQREADIGEDVEAQAPEHPSASVW